MGNGRGRGARESAGVLKKSRLALLGGQPVGAPRRPPYPRFGAAAVGQVVALLERGETVGLGRTSPAIQRAEEALTRYHGGRQAMVLNSGQAALMAALMGLEIGPGDEVVTTPYTWGASTSCILATGAIPVFADVDPVSGLLDPGSVEAAITRRTRAILAVHLYGQPADMPALQRVARRHGLAVVEDGSQAHGATIRGQVVGSFSDAAGFSCMGGKILPTSEAGYLVTPRPEVYWRAAMMCQHYGRSADPGFPEEYRPYVDSLVFTFRLSPLIAALFPSQVGRLDREVAARQENAAAFREAVRDCGFLRFPRLKAGFLPAYHMLTMNFVPARAGVTRQTLLRALQAEGVGIFAYVPESLHRWRRLQWQGYRGPVPFWLPNLRQAGTDYAAADLPHCEHKVAHSLEMGWNYYRPDVRGMRRLASAFLKVQDHLDELRAHEAKQHEREERREDRFAAAARRAAKAARGTRA